MQKLLLFLAFLGNAVRVEAQKTATKGYGERLEAVHSAASLYDFMFSLPPEAGNIDGSKDSLMANAAQSCFIYQIRTDSVEAAELDACARYQIPNQQLWARRDFDGDGRPDLFFNNGYGHAYAVLNRDAAIPLVAPLIVHGGWRDCHSFTLIQHDGKWLIEHLQISRRRHFYDGRTKEPQVWHDTLVYHLGSFVEYNARPNPELPRVIGLRYRSGGPPPTSGYDLLINLKTGLVKRQLVRYKEPHPIKKLRYRLSTGVLDTLQQRLTYLNIAGLREEYTRDASDASTIILSFHYPHRQTKSVEDYGLTGTHGMLGLYDLLLHTYEQAENRQESDGTNKH